MAISSSQLTSCYSFFPANTGWRSVEASSGKVRGRGHLVSLVLSDSEISLVLVYCVPWGLCPRCWVQPIRSWLLYQKYTRLEKSSGLHFSLVASQTSLLGTALRTKPAFHAHHQLSLFLVGLHWVLGLHFTPTTSRLFFYPSIALRTEPMFHACMSQSFFSWDCAGLWAFIPPLPSPFVSWALDCILQPCLHTSPFTSLQLTTFFSSLSVSLQWISLWAELMCFLGIPLLNYNCSGCCSF